MPETIRERLSRVEVYREKRQVYLLLQRHLSLILDDTLEHAVLPYGVSKSSGLAVLRELRERAQDLELDEGLLLNEMVPVEKRIKTPPTAAGRPKLQGKPLAARRG